MNQPYLQIKSPDDEGFIDLHSTTLRFLTASQIGCLFSGVGYESTQELWRRWRERYEHRDDPETLKGILRMREEKDKANKWKQRKLQHGRDNEPKVREKVRAVLKDYGYIPLQIGCVVHREGYFAGTPDDMMISPTDLIFPVEIKSKEPNQSFSADLKREDIPQNYLIQSLVQMSLVSAPFGLLVWDRNDVHYFILVPFHAEVFQYIHERGKKVIELISQGEKESEFSAKITNKAKLLQDQQLGKLSKSISIFKSLAEFHQTISQWKL